MVHMDMSVKLLQLIRGRYQDELWLQSDYPLDIRMHRVANLRDVLRFGRIVTIGRVPDQSIARTNSIDNLRKVRRQRNYAIDFCGQRDAATGFVDDFASFDIRT